MGPQHIQVENKVVFNAPYARNKGFNFDYPRMEGTIVEEIFNQDTFKIAEGQWYNRFDNHASKQRALANYRKDPHNQDQTGFSFASGKFFAKERKSRQNPKDFAIGAPNVDNLYGKVYICRDCFGKNPTKLSTLYASKPQRGERYGGAIATVDINGDGLDEIIVGAPLHCKSEKVDTGRVLVYDGMNNNNVYQTEIMPNELESYSRFGSSIAKLGDIHNDGFEDFAVGAPNVGGEGAGSVFIFHGCNDFAFGKFPMKLSAKYF